MLWLIGGKLLSLSYIIERRDAKRSRVLDVKGGVTFSSSAAALDQSGEHQLRQEACSGRLIVLGGSSVSLLGRMQSKVLLNKAQNSKLPWNYKR